MQAKKNTIVLFRTNLASAMKAKGWTQGQLSDHSGIRQGNISHYLTGRREPKAEQLHQLAQALGVSMEWLLAGENASPNGKAAPKSLSTQARKAIRDARTALEKLESELDSGD